MKTSEIIAAVIVALPLLAFTQSAIAKSLPAYNPPEKPVGEMLQPKSEKSWKDWQAKDPKAYADILAEGYTAVLPDGKGPRDEVAALADMQGMTIGKYALSDFKATPLGEKAELVTYRANADVTIGANTGRAGLAVAEVWVKQEGNWKLLHYQETEVK
ncbi:MAG TPA: nuclear transport factor 2 family protein [Gemmatimonadaceae bacterium]|nr:nuclear transport factor 2 family protein [Gemmatimonadaceae bacterium]